MEKVAIDAPGKTAASLQHSADRKGPYGTCVFSFSGWLILNVSLDFTTLLKRK